MSKYKLYVSLGVLVILLFIYSVDSIAQQKEYSLWNINLYQQNKIKYYDDYASDLTNNKFIEYSIVSIEHNSSKGDFRSPRDSYTTNDFLFFTQGQRKIDKLYLAGTFTMLNTSESGAVWGLSQRIESGNPFLLADSIAADWKKTSFNANCSLAYKSDNDKFSIGLNTSIIASNANRYSNPKPVLYRNKLSLSSSISYTVNNESSVAVQIKFINDKEQIESFSQGLYSSSIFKLKGLGAKYDNYGLKRNSRLTTKQISIVYKYGLSKNTSLIQKLYFNNSTDLNIDNKGYKSSYVFGRYKSKIYGYNISLNKKTELVNNLLSFKYTKSLAKGILGDDTYAYFIHNKNVYNIEYSALYKNKLEWKFNINYSSDLIMQRSIGNKQVLRNVCYGFGLKYNKSFDKFDLSICPTVSHRSNIYKQLRIIKDNIIIRQLVIPNFEFLSQNYFAYKLKFRLEKLLMSRYMFTELTLTSLKSAGVKSISREGINIKLGFLF